eukprot:13297494-Alexandrium_andersonii.AAC.1
MCIRDRHSAEIKRSFAKFGHMDPYAVIEVDSKEARRLARSAREKPFCWGRAELPEHRPSPPLQRC